MGKFESSAPPFPIVTLSCWPFLTLFLFGGQARASLPVPLWSTGVLLGDNELRFGRSHTPPFSGWGRLAFAVKLQ